MRRLFAIIFAAIAFVGCSMDDITVSYQTDKSDIYYASFEDFGEESRTYVDENVKLLWHEDDRISLFRTTLNEQYKFTGATGDNSGGFSAISSDEFVTGNEVSTNYAVYPYDATTKLSNDEIIQLTMPAVQQYAVNSFGRGANTMVAASENTSSNFLPFRNLGGYIIVKLYGEDTTIKSIEFKGNNDEVIAGAATAEAKYGYLPVVAMSESGTTTITLDCGEEGVTISSDSANPTSFWFVVPPITFEGGFTFTITDINGNTFTKSTTKSQTVVRNGIKSMSAFEPTFEGEGEDPEVAPKPANNEIWYTNGSTTEATTPHQTSVFGANIISNTYDAEKKCWVIKFDGNVTKIGDGAFYNCQNLKSITIPDSVTTIGGAFTLCTKLTSINIPDSVTTIGEAAFNRCDILTSITIPNSVSTIERNAFAGCYGLTSITIPNGVTTIQGNTFLNCESLTSVTIPNSVTAIEWCAFEGCKSLTNITLPDSVTSIGERAFSGCTSLTSITISNRLTTIGNSAFYNCTSLTSITIPNSVTTIGNSAFSDCESLASVTIGDSVTTIGNSAFYYCTSLTSVTIPDSVTLIEASAFCGCSSLTSITIPDSVTSIGDRAFDCKELKSVYCKATTPPSLGGDAFSTFAYNLKIYVPNESVEVYKGASGWSEYTSNIIGYNFKPTKGEIWYTNGSTTEATTPYQTNVFGANIVSNTYDAERGCWIIKFDGYVTTIGEKAFYECSSLTSVTIPDSVTSIGYFAFGECTSLTSVTIPDSVTSIGSSAFNCCTSLTSVTIPDSVTAIGDFAFCGCSGLTSITIPNGVLRIRISVFDGCSSLTSVTIPDSVTEIESCAFYGCTSLTSVTIPNGVLTIGGWAFKDCSSLISVYYKTTTVPSGGDRMFDGNAPGRKIYVRRNMVEYIKAAEGWSEYASDIVGYDFASCSVNHNSQWRLSSSVSNPDSSLYDGVYESNSNYNVNNGVATMYIDITGYTEFSFYVRSYAESNYDYVMVSQLDKTITGSTSYSDTTLVKAHTRGNQQSGSSISNYTKVTYSNISSGTHRITIVYRKDSGVNANDDRGYVLIPKNQ